MLAAARWTRRRRFACARGTRSRDPARMGVIAEDRAGAGVAPPRHARRRASGPELVPWVAPTGPSAFVATQDPHAPRAENLHVRERRVPPRVELCLARAPGVWEARDRGLQRHAGRAPGPTSAAPAPRVLQSMGGHRHHPPGAAGRLQAARCRSCVALRRFRLGATPRDGRTASRWVEQGSARRSTLPTGAARSRAAAIGRSSSIGLHTQDALQARAFQDGATADANAARGAPRARADCWSTYARQMEDPRAEARGGRSAELRAPRVHDAFLRQAFGAPGGPPGCAGSPAPNNESGTSAGACPRSATRGRPHSID
jgi:hypothetical protein